MHTQRALLSEKCRKERERRRDCREKEEIGKERNSRHAVCIYVQEEDTGEYNCPLEGTICRKDSMSICVSVFRAHTHKHTIQMCMALF